jgi:hypothetical protein
MQDAVGVVASRSCLRRSSHEAGWERAPNNHRIQLCKSNNPYSHSNRHVSARIRFVLVLYQTASI